MSSSMYHQWWHAIARAMAPPPKPDDHCSQSAQSKPPSPSPDKQYLLNLPPELRNRIYEYALFHSTCISFPNWLITEPGLLRCNRQIREETYSMFWSLNTFHFGDTKTAEIGLTGLHAKKIVALRSVRACSADVAVQSRDWLKYVDFRLRGLWAACEEKGLAPDVIKMPLKVTGEEEVQWVSLEEADDFEIGVGGFVVRKKDLMPH